MNERDFLLASDKDKKKRRKKIILMSVGAVAGLAIIFFVSFYAAYSKIAPKQIVTQNQDESAKQMNDRVTELEQQLQQRDEEIEVLKGLLDKYKSAVPERPEVTVPLTPKKSTVKATPTPAPKTSPVQADLYNKPGSTQ